jgi:DNA-binding transcriptional regulator YiaG
MQGLNETVGYQQGKIPVRKTKLTIKPIIAFYKNDIKHIRQYIELCHIVFVGLLGVSPKTAEACKNGHNKLKGVSRRLHKIVKADLLFLSRYQTLVRQKQ